MANRATPHQPYKTDFKRSHRTEVMQRDDKQRGTAHERGYGSKWQTARKAYLIQHPLCKKCLSNTSVVAATVVDHIIPHRGDMQLFWDSGNWQPLCKTCHDHKTLKEGR